MLAAALPTYVCVDAQVTGPDGQVLDTTGIYRDRSDSLEAAVSVSRQQGSYLSRGKTVRTEVISSAGLRKMACCSLAESFENSASVTVGYSDAVTGARQIRLLGLSGIYTQMLDENRPVMRGFSSPFGLSYVPGQWLESIQIAKGASSVVNGVESVTGQINLEFRKPLDEKPLFLNASVMSDTRMDFNIASSLQMGRNWSTVILGHISGNIRSSDHNRDGFMDAPEMLQFNLANRWLYYADNGVQLRFGVRALQDMRRGGQEGYDYRTYSIDEPDVPGSDPWGSDITGRLLNGYVKVGIPLGTGDSQNIAFVADYTFQDMDSHFGSTSYLGQQHSLFANLMYQNEINDRHRFVAGLNGVFDRYDEDLSRTVRVIGPVTLEKNGVTGLGYAGAFGEYTFRAGDKFTAMAGLRGDWYSNGGFRLSPRAMLKYSPVEEITVRVNGGRGLRYAVPLVDNIGVFSTGKMFYGNYEEHTLEDAWTFGGNITYYFHFGASPGTYLSFDYFRTMFAQQMVVDYEMGGNAIWFYNLDGNRSWSDNYQLDFSVDPVERFNITVTCRYTDAKIELPGRGLVEKPMTSNFKGVLNLQYATRLSKWIFDFTASLNGSCRVYDFMLDAVDADGNLLYGNGRTPVYPLLYAQVTRRFRGVEVYAGGENLTNFRQKNVILGTRGSDGFVNPRVASFYASAVWGPLMGVKVYAGVRFTLWKKI